MRARTGLQAARTRAARAACSPESDHQVALLPADGSPRVGGWGGDQLAPPAGPRPTQHGTTYTWSKETLRERGYTTF